MSKTKSWHKYKKSAVCSAGVVFHPELVPVVGSVNAAIVLAQIIYWQDKGSEIEGWACITAQDWLQRTTLTNRQVTKVRKVLLELGLLSEQRRGLPGKIYLRIDVDRLIELVEGR